MIRKKNKYVGVGVSVIVRKDNKILLGRRSKMHSHGIDTWCCAGGHIEFGEALENCAEREVLEETNVKIKNLQFLGITNDIFKKENKHYVTLWYKADYKSGRAKPTEELLDVGWYAIDEIPKPLFLCIKNYLKKFKDWK